MSGEKKTLSERLGGYGAIAAVAMISCPQQLLIDFLCANAGGTMYYRSRDMVLV